VIGGLIRTHTNILAFMRLLTMAVHLLSTVGTVIGSNVKHLSSAEDPEAVIRHALPGSVRTRQDASGTVRNHQDTTGSITKLQETAGRCRKLREPSRK
jgi:hypothetical protein